MASYDTYYEQIKKQTAADRQAAKDKSNKIFENQKAVANEQFKAQLKDTTSAYDEQYRLARIQKAVNERQIVENMANMGLTDSGLNRTQVTANQLSYGNRIGRIDTEKQKATDALALALRSNTTTIENNRISAEAAIDDKYDKYASDVATDMYKADVAAASRSYSSGGGSKGSVVRYTRVREEGNYVVYRDQNGKETKVAKGLNPYTGNKANKSSTTTQYGVWNGYQPKGVMVGLTSYNKPIYAQLSGTGQQAYDAYGNLKNVLQTKYNGQTRYWMWDDYSDDYLEVGIN